ncbi:MAG TPA: 3-oxoacid CoA-transferase subunit B [Acetobacteraceae bacterium]|jgi:3-oxoadipate CoA-transferase beta subunit
MAPLTREQMAARVARALPHGAFVNLGIGMPSLVARHIAPAQDVTLHSENGLLLFGGPPPAGMADTDLVDAGKNPVTILPGGSYFDSSLSFSMMRGGHLDVAVLGGFEVSAGGDLSNWWTGAADDPQGVGGAMDLASGARQIWVLMEHRTRDGRPKIVERCAYPLTARGVVTRIFTDLAVIAVRREGLVVEEMVGGWIWTACRPGPGRA